MDEDAFLIALRNNPNDETTRLVYADWLDERNDPRGAFIRLEQEYLALPIKDRRRAGLLSRLRRQAWALNPTWLCIVSRPAIEKCRLNLKFAFECPKQWDQLQPTENSNARFCDVCNKLVHYCRTIREAREHANRGECIAVAPGLPRTPGDVRGPMPLVGILPPRPPPIDGPALGIATPHEEETDLPSRRRRRRRPEPPEDDEDAPPPRKRKRR
jgi:uncharacterized protein (TIGR02996 family)